MGVYSVAHVYQELVIERANSLWEDIAAKSGVMGHEIRKGLSAIVNSAANDLQSNWRSMSREEIMRKSQGLQQASVVVDQLISPKYNVLMPILRSVAEKNVTMEQVIERAKSMGIGVDDKEAFYVI